MSTFFHFRPVAAKKFVDDGIKTVEGNVCINQTVTLRQFTSTSIILYQFETI